MKTFQFLYTILLYCCLNSQALIMRDPATREEVRRFETPVVSRYVGPTETKCSNETNLSPVAVRAKDQFCSAPSHEMISYYVGKMIVVADIFKVNPGKCSIETSYMNMVQTGARAIVMIQNRAHAGQTIVYHGVGEPVNVGEVVFLAGNKALAENLTFDAEAGNLSSNFVFDVTCDKSKYEISVYYIGPILFGFLGAFALRNAYYAWTAIRYFRKKGKNVSQVAILSVQFFMQTVAGTSLLLGFTGFTTHNWIFGNVAVGYQYKTIISNVLTSFNLLSVLWTAIFWSLLQKQILSMSKIKSGSSPNIFRKAPIRTGLAPLTVGFEIAVTYKAIVFDTSLQPMFAPIFLLLSLCCGCYFYYQVNSFFKVTGYTKTVSKGGQKSNKNVPNFVIHLARALKRFALFLALQVVAVMAIFGASLNTNPYMQNASSFIFASGTFGMAYYIIMGLSPSRAKPRKYNNDTTTGGSGLKSNSVAPFSSSAPDASAVSSAHE